jgi:hypothetical protein
MQAVHGRGDAAAEMINSPYVSCVLRLTLLAPDIINAILDGRQPAEMTLAGLMRSFAAEWREQSRLLRLSLPETPSELA